MRRDVCLDHGRLLSESVLLESTMRILGPLVKMPALIGKIKPFVSS